MSSARSCTSSRRRSSQASSCTSTAARAPATIQGAPMRPPPPPNPPPLSRLDAELDAPIALGDPPQGHRRIVALTGGRAEGPDFHAELLASGGADWQIV